MIEVMNKKLVVENQTLPKGDVDILIHLIREGPVSAFRLMELTGKMYVQYVQYRLRVLKMLGVVISPRRGYYEVTPEIKEELEEKMEDLK